MYIPKYPFKKKAAEGILNVPEGRGKALFSDSRKCVTAWKKLNYG